MQLISEIGRVQVVVEARQLSEFRINIDHKIKMTSFIFEEESI